MQIVFENQWIRSMSQLPGFDFADAIKVTTLKLNENPIVDFKQLVAFKNLQHLEIDNTNIEELPIEIAQLTSLQHLSCKHNLLTEIPKWLGDLTELEVLNLQGNEIDDLPLIFENLSQLKELHVDYNNIHDFSAELIYQLGRLNLKVFATNGNPLSQIKAGLMAISSTSESDTKTLNKTSPPDAKQKLSILGEQLKGPLGYLNQVKVVILGGGGVGKSTLIQSVIYGEAPENTLTTEGIDIYTTDTNDIDKSWDPEIYVHGGAVKVAIWDFGGQHIFHNTSKLFLSEQTIYVILDDIQVADRSHGVKYWLRHIEHINKGEKKSPILVAFHRADKPEQESYVEDLSDELIRDFGVQECLCTSKERPGTLQKFKEILKEAIRQIAQQQDNVPLHFIKARDKLLKHSRPYISRSQLKEILWESRYGENEEKADNEIDDIQVNHCIDFFNQIGIIVKLSSNRYNSTYVLNPNWISKAIYSIIQSPILRSKKVRGKFTVQSLIDYIEVLKNGYNDMEVGFIIDLMVDYKLAFPIADRHGEKTYLIPAHLGSRNTAKLQLADTCLRMRLNYYVGNEKGNDFSEHTKSVFARFICQHYSAVDSDTVKRDYCLLTDQNHTIEIYIVPQSGDKELEIRVQGRNPARYLNKYLHLLEISNNYFEARAIKMIPIPSSDGEVYWQNYDELVIAKREGETTLFISAIRKRIDILEVLSPYVSETKQDRITTETEKIRNHKVPVERIRTMQKIKDFKCAYSAETLYQGLVNGTHEHLEELHQLISADFKSLADLIPNPLNGTEEWSEEVKREWMHNTGQMLPILEDAIRQFDQSVDQNREEWEHLIKKLYIPIMSSAGAYKVSAKSGDQVGLDVYFHFLITEFKRIFSLEDAQFNYSINVQKLPAKSPLLMKRIGDVIANLLAHEIFLFQASNKRQGKIHFSAMAIDANRCQIEISRQNPQQELDKKVGRLIDQLVQQWDGSFSGEENTWKLSFKW